MISPHAVDRANGLETLAGSPRCLAMAEYNFYINDTEIDFSEWDIPDDRVAKTVAELFAWDMSLTRTTRNRIQSNRKATVRRSYCRAQANVGALIADARGEFGET